MTYRGHKETPLHALLVIFRCCPRLRHVLFSAVVGCSLKLLGLPVNLTSEFDNKKDKTLTLEDLNS
jgi:hypothetical protein